MDIDDEVQVEPMEAPSSSTALDIARLASEQVQLEAEVARLEEQLEDKKKALSRVRDGTLPQAMADAGLADFTLTTGYKIEVKDRYSCPQLDDSPDDERVEKGEKRPLTDRLAALNWLDENKHGDIAKRTVTVVLGADAVDLQEEIEALIRSHRMGNQLQITKLRLIPWNTLASFAREQLGQNEDIPLDVLGVSVQRSAKIIAPKDQRTPFRGKRRR